MPLFEIDATGELVPFRRLRGGDDLYEREIEDLAWANPEQITGESLFLVKRQPVLNLGGRPDIVALDRDARVVVIEVKRDVDRSQLAQCLEYAGWARRTNLDELAQMYHLGEQSFFTDWQAFTGSDVPAIVNASPRLILLAASFRGPTQSAIDFLIENRVPVKIVPITIYEDQQGRKFVNIEAEHEPEFPGVVSEDAFDHTRINGRKIQISDLLDNGRLESGEALYWERSMLGTRYEATVTDTGGIQIGDGRVFSSPSRAAVEAAGIPAADGWLCWRVARVDDLRLSDLRRQLAESARTSQ